MNVFKNEFLKIIWFWLQSFCYLTPIRSSQKRDSDLKKIFKNFFERFEEWKFSQSLEMINWILGSSECQDAL